MSECADRQDSLHGEDMATSMALYGTTIQKCMFANSKSANKYVVTIHTHAHTTFGRPKTAFAVMVSHKPTGTYMWVTTWFLLL